MKLVILLVTFTVIHALPEGAPTKACRTLTPFHGGGIPKQTDASPFSLQTNLRRGRVLISIASSIGSPFQGFMIQGRTPDQNTIGQFESSGDIVKFIDCGGIANTATHSSPVSKQRIDLEWNSNGYEGPVVFKYAT